MGPTTYLSSWGMKKSRVSIKLKGAKREYGEQALKPAQGVKEVGILAERAIKLKIEE